MAADVYSFPPFRLDVRAARLWCGAEERLLRPKTFAVLHYLVTRIGRLTTKEELLAAVWPRTTVSDAALTVCVRELRQVLKDQAQAPRFIETVHGRGYRFMAQVVSDQSSATQRSVPVTLPSQSPTSLFVGREGELKQIHSLFVKAHAGERQLAFVTGEPGIGKTTLIDRVLAQVQGDNPAWVGRGQGIEQYGNSEPYLMILEALTQMCRGPEGHVIREVLSRHAPTWLLQMPGLVEADALEDLRARAAGTNSQRMLREMADALEALSRERVVILVCEDLHAADPSSCELLAYLAQRRGPARLLLIGTYRPVEVVLRAHPIRRVLQELLAHQQCVHLPLELLPKRVVAQYLKQRLAPGLLPDGLITQVHERTDGNPLFMVAMLDYLLQQHVLYDEVGQWRLRDDLQRIGVPESVRQLIEKQIEQLSPQEQQVLEMASVAGVEFSSTAMKAACAIEISPSVLGSLEEHCERLVQHFPFIHVRTIHEQPDGTWAVRYGFRHSLYREVLYNRIPELRRLRWHRQMK